VSRNRMRQGRDALTQAFQVVETRSFCPGCWDAAAAAIKVATITADSRSWKCITWVFHIFMHLVFHGFQAQFTGAKPSTGYFALLSALGHRTDHIVWEALQTGWEDNCLVTALQPHCNCLQLPVATEAVARGLQGGCAAVAK